MIGGDGINDESNKTAPPPFSHEDFSGLGRACRPRNGLDRMVLVSPPERTGKDYGRHAPGTVYPSFAAERGVRRVDRAEDACRRCRRCVSTWRRRICRPCRRRGSRARRRSDPYPPAVAAVARGGSCELAQAAAYCDQDLGTVGGRAWRGGLPFHGDAGGGTDRAGVTLLAARPASRGRPAEWPAIPLSARPASRHTYAQSPPTRT